MVSFQDTIQSMSYFLDKWSIILCQDIQKAMFFKIDILRRLEGICLVRAGGVTGDELSEEGELSPTWPYSF